MILAIGTDLVDVKRLAQRLGGTPRLTTRLLTADEQRACQGRPHSVAARLAAKEAVLKAMGSALAQAGEPVPTGWRYTDVEIVSVPGTPPALALHGVVARSAGLLGVRRWHLSLAHDAGLAQATVLAED